MEGIQEKLYQDTYILLDRKNFYCRREVWDNSATFEFYNMRKTQ